jgi:hypothetical protein
MERVWDPGPRTWDADNKWLKIIACEVFYREVSSLVAESPHTCDVEFLPRGLHDLGSERMSSRLQEAIDASQDGPHDAICLIYGLCNNGIVGLQSRSKKLVVPRAHDCITLFLGSRQKFKEYFDAHPGTWYRTTGWYERSDADSAGEDGIMDKLGLVWERQKLIDKYGEEAADYLIATMGDLTAHYDRLAFVTMGLECEANFEKMAIGDAEKRGWAFEKVEGSMELLRKALHGEWDQDFLVLEPGQTVEATFDEGVIGCDGCAGRT